MSLFAPLNVRAMGTAALVELEAICLAMLAASVAEQHRDDYADLHARLVAERVQRERAATMMQAIVRGNAVRDELNRKNDAAIVLQSAFRMYAAKKSLKELKDIRDEATRKKLEAETAAQLTKTTKAEAKLGGTIVDASTVAAEVKIHLGDLILVYEREADKAQGKKQSTPAAARARTAKKEVDDYVQGLIQMVEAALAATVSAANALRTVTLPADFRQEGASVDRGNFLYPGAGRLSIGTSLYRLHPNRSLVHVADELAPDATLATAQAYLDSLLAACRTVINAQRRAPLNVISDYIRVNDRTDTGRPFFWRLLYTRYDPGAQAQGYAGSIEHIDSGYERSAWRG